MVTEKLYHLLQGPRLNGSGGQGPFRRSDRDDRASDWNPRCRAGRGRDERRGVAAISGPARPSRPRRRRPSGWQLPPDAAETKNPLTVDAKLLATGKARLQGQVSEMPRPRRPRRRSGRGSGRRQHGSDRRQAGRAQPRRGRLLQDLERPQEAEDARRRRTSSRRSRSGPSWRTCSRCGRPRRRSGRL